MKFLAPAFVLRSPAAGLSLRPRLGQLGSHATPSQRLAVGEKGSYRLLAFCTPLAQRGHVPVLMACNSAHFVPRHAMKPQTYKSRPRAYKSRPVGHFAFFGPSLEFLRVFVGPSLRLRWTPLEPSLDNLCNFLVWCSRRLGQTRGPTLEKKTGSHAPEGKRRAVVVRTAWPSRS